MDDHKQHARKNPASAIRVNSRAGFFALVLGEDQMI